MRELEKEGLSPSEARQLLQLGTCLNCSYGNVFAPNLYFLRWVLTAAPTAGRDQVRGSALPQWDGWNHFALRDRDQGSH